MIAGRNFGLGPSRPAATMLRELGMAALVAEGLSSLFLRHCINHGLPALTVPGVRGHLQRRRHRLSGLRRWLDREDHHAHLPNRLPLARNGHRHPHGRRHPPMLAREGYIPSIP
ncbi:hypothetical protein V5F01_15475 [Streptomyces sp. NRRL B-2790]